MILTGQRIAEAVRAGDITISPFDESALNPNSYNYRLGPTLRTFADDSVDSGAEIDYIEHKIDDDGFVLQPRRVYLGTTEEIIGSTRYVPSLIGRSSLGRLGIFLQISADLGNLGAIHQWTLEIVVCQPIRVYAGMVVGQVSFWATEGARTPYSGFFGQYSDAVLPPSGQFN